MQSLSGSHVQVIPRNRKGEEELYLKNYANSAQLELQQPGPFSVANRQQDEA